MRKHYSYGIDPVELAHIFKKGIENDVLYVFAFPEPEKMLRDNFERMINYLTPEGMKRQDEAEKKRHEEMIKHPNPSIDGAEAVGWGKARPDISWVAKEHKVPE